MKRDFCQWLSQFRNSIATYEYYVNFEKIYQNIDKIRLELNLLNSLLGSHQIEKDFQNLVTKYPETLKCIPILLAVRQNEIFAMDNEDGCVYNFNSLTCSLERYTFFMRQTGLFDLIQNHIISNLVDYVTGVETGLDSNGRKNRSGDLMESLLERYLQNTGAVHNVSYFKEMNLSEIEYRWGLNLSALSNQGKAEKRFDFVVKTASMTYGIETNFYSTGGSKLNEVARSYKTLALESAEVAGFTFIWITDGHGWFSARNNLEETFDVMQHLYCIEDLKRGVLRDVLV